VHKFEHFRRPISRRNRPDELVAEIKYWIVTGGLRPGDRLPQESKLIELLQSSRGTVREALKVLESQGIVEVTRGANGGARVSNVSYEKTSQALRNFLYFQTPTWSQVYKIREKLEPRMAEEVVDVLTEEDIGALKETVEVCKLGIKGDVEPRTHRNAELEFHDILAQACPDPMLRFMCRFINDLLRDLAVSDSLGIIGPRDTRFASEAIRFHTELIHAYEAKDRDRVRALMADHVHDAGCIVSERESSFDRATLLVPPVDEGWSSSHKRGLRRSGSGSKGGPEAIGD
jgi:DNA-binding FadR family transcriptional regulator